MGITVQHSPAASLYGTAGFMAGRGNHDIDQRKRRDQLALAIEEMQQRERMQGAQIAASRQNTQDSLAANDLAQRRSLGARQAENAQNIIANERSTLFGRIADQSDREQAGRVSAYLNQQKFGQDVAMEGVRAELERREETAKQEDRLKFALRAQDEKRRQIEAESQRRIDAVNRGMAEGAIPQDAGQEHIARINDQAQGLIVGAEELPSSLGPTPQEQLQEKWNDNVLMVNGIPTQWNEETGQFDAMRGWQFPDDAANEKAQQAMELVEAKAKQAQEAAQVKIEAEKQQAATKIKADAAKYAIDLMTKTVKKPLLDKNGNPKKDLEGNVELYDAPLFNTLEEAEAKANSIFGLGQQAASDIQGPPAPEGYDFDAALRGQKERMAADQPPAGPDAGYELNPNATNPEIPPAGERQPIVSFNALQQLGGIAPPDLTTEELGAIGRSIVPLEQLPEPYHQPMQAFQSVTARLPEGKQSTWQRRSLRIMEGAMLAYGPDPNQWPPEVIDRIRGEAATVRELLIGQKAGGKKQTLTTGGSTRSNKPPIDINSPGLGGIQGGS